MALAVVSNTPSTIAAGTNHLIDYPATVDAGDLLIIEIMWPSSTTIADDDDLTPLYTYTVGSLRLSGFAKIADGTEDGTTVNVQSSASIAALASVYRISGFEGTIADHIDVGGGSTGNTDADPPTATAGNGSAENLYITSTCLDNNEDVSAFPSGYSAGADLVAASYSLHSAYLIETSASDDPGIFNYVDADSGDTWQAETIVIGPQSAAATDTTSLYPTSDGTDTDIVDEGDATTDLYASIDDDPGSPSDGDWNNNTDDAGQAFYQLTDMPSDFEEAQSATITVRYRGQEFDGTGTVTLYARLYQSDESTALSDEVQVAQVTSDTSFANTSAVTLTGIVASDKTTWDGARLRLRWERT